MKLKLLLLSVASVLAFCGCAAFDNAGTDAAQTFEQGISGQGRIVSPNPTGDSFGSYYD